MGGENLEEKLSFYFDLKPNKINDSKEEAASSE